MSEMLPNINISHESWESEANCIGVDPDLFFPEAGDKGEEAKEVCRGCPVQEQCLEKAIANREVGGIWGGTSESERRRIIRQRKKLAKAALKS